MIRNFVIVAGAALIGLAIYSFAAGVPAPAAIAELVPGLLMVLGGLYEHKGYKPIEDHLPPGSWHDTGERFIDPATKRTVAVYSDPKTGRRVYIAADRSAQ